MAELGLAPDENFASLKNDPTKYDKVKSYVKTQVYKSPAYASLESGQMKPEFVSQQMGEYSQLPYERMGETRQKFEGSFNIPALREQADSLQAGAYAAPTRLREEISKKGGYDIEGLKDTFENLRVDYANAYRDFSEGRISPAQYGSIISRLSTAARSLEKGQTGLEGEVNKALGQYQMNTDLASRTYENAYAKYQQAVTDEQAGYTEARNEKKQAAEEMFNAAKEILDQSRQEEDAYQGAMGKIYNPYTGQYVFKPRLGGGGGRGGGGSSSKLFNEADSLRGELSKGNLEWGQAWNRLKAQFPEANNAQIDAALGGSGGYDTNTGTFDPNKATGFGKQGARGGENFDSRPLNQREAEVWKELADNPDVDDETKAEWIMRKGLDPNKFGIN